MKNFRVLLSVTILAIGLGCARKSVIRTESVAPAVMKSSTGAAPAEAPAPAAQPMQQEETAPPVQEQVEPREHGCG